MNPFAVSQVGLAELEYIEPSAGMLELVLQRLKQHQWRGQIIGPHGSGKTTLTIAIARQLNLQFSRLTWLVIQPGSWFAARPRCRVQLAARCDGKPGELQFVEFQAAEKGLLTATRLRQIKAGELCFVDGVDQLSQGWQRRLIAAAGEHPVVWTSHQPLDSVPLLVELMPDLVVFRELVGKLLSRTGASLVGAAVEQAFHAAGGDYRRAFSLLYDRWEQQRRR